MIEPKTNWRRQGGPLFGRHLKEVTVYELFLSHRLSFGSWTIMCLSVALLREVGNIVLNMLCVTNLAGFPTPESPTSIMIRSSVLGPSQ